MLTNRRILETFVSENDIWKVLYKFKSDIEQKEKTYLNMVEDEVKGAEKLVLSFRDNYKQKVFIKLNSIFRLQVILNDEEAENFYNNEDNFNYINRRFYLLYNIIDYINDELGIQYIPDKLTICAYFRISADTWTTFIGYSNLRVEVKNLFTSLEEFTISSITTGVENGTLSKQAWRKLEMKGKYGGNEVEYTTSQNSGNGYIEGSIYDKQKQLEHKLNSKYNFVIETPEDSEES